VPTPGKIKKQVDMVVRYLVEVGLANDQNFAFRRELTGGRVEVTFPQAEHVSIAIRDRSYPEIYEHLAGERAYNAKMPDGALVQMIYVFDSLALERHRLAFFPAPHLEEFQNNPEIYVEDEIYADVIAKNVVPFPLRFDYDARDGIYKKVNHPKSHLTLGQYENCRIPVTAPLTPYWFIDFILRNFYHTAFHRYADQLPSFDDVFDESIVSAEKKVVHVQIPGGVAWRT
jgi:hypothetical protein